MADITMPQLGETVTEGTITRWMKKVGDPIAEDEVLFEVSTDKVDSEVPSPAAGVVAEILVQEGETVDVGTRLAVISDGAAAPAPAPTQEEAAPDAAPPVTTREVDGSAEAPGGVTAPDGAPSDPAPVVEDPERPAPRPGGPQAHAGPQRNGSSTRPGDDRPAGRPGEGSGKVLSPVVRRLIAEYDLDPEQIAGSGAGGRITRADVLDAIDAQAGGRPQAAQGSAPGSAPATASPATASPATASPADRGPAAPEPSAVAGAGDTVVPFTNIRRRTAEHMVRSKHTSAHTLVAVEVDYSAVDAVRQVHKDGFKQAEGFSLTYLPFVSRAVVDALAEFPHVNSSVGEDQLLVHGDINLGIAVDLDFEGLLVPVVHQADGKRLRAIARDISSLAAKARAKRLTMDDITGGTLTITNAGPFGTFITVPVINQPQVAIISTDGVRKKPVVVETPGGGDAIAIHPVGVLAMSWDHRAFDGAYAAAFLARVKSILETRDWSAEL